MDIATALRWGKEALRAAVDPQWAELATPELDAELILAEVVGVSRAQLFAHDTDQLSESHLERFQKLIARRVQGEPVAHLLGKKEFFGLELCVSPAVLTPRPETELLVEMVLSFLQLFPAATILDIGTGSGAIALALAQQLDSAFHIHGLDLSAPALEIARQNADKLHLSRVHFTQSDLLSDFTLPADDPEPIVVVANLPYVPAGDVLPREVMQYEPHAALFSGSDGLTLYRRFFGELQAGIRQDDEEMRTWTVFFFEFHPPQREFFTQLSTAQFPEYELKFLPDLAGKFRFGMLLRKEQAQIA